MKQPDVGLQATADKVKSMNAKDSFQRLLDGCAKSAKKIKKN